jgi:copper transport protein
MKPRARVAIAAALALLALLNVVSTALAHAELVGSDPADGAVLDRASERVQLFFSEPIEPEFFSVQVYAADRTRIDRGDARISPTDARVLEVGLREAGGGSFTVVWRALSLDGHVVRGSFAFAVGAGATPGRPLELALPAEGAPFPLESAARWLTFLAAFVLLGGFAFRPLVLDQALAATDLDDAGLKTALARRWLWVGWPALALLLVVSFVALLFQAASAAGVPLGEVLSGRAVTRILTATRFGAMWMARVALIVAMVGVLAWLGAASKGGSRGLWWSGAALSAAVLLTISASGHASAVPDWTALAILADWAHLVAGGLWVGGLVQFGLVLPTMPLAADAAGRRRLLGRLVPRFSWLAGVSVGILALTGLYAGLLHVPSWAALLDTAYGAALSGKLIVIAPLLALGALNLLVMHPRFRRAAAARGRPRDDAAARRAFRLLVLGEVGLAIVVLAVTGVLTGLPPATSVPLEGRPFRDTQRSASLVATLSINPNQAGENTLDVAVRNPAGTTPPGIERVSLAMAHLDMDMAPREVVAEPIGDGLYRTQGGYLSMTGRWQVAARVRLAGGAEEAVEFAPTVGPAPGANRPAFSPGRILLLAVADPSRERGFPVNLRFAAALVVGIAGAWVVVRAMSGARLRRGASAIGVGALVVGLMLFGTSVADAYRRSLPNPFPADAASLARGQEVYQAQCASCHGVTGRGDGPAGVVLRPRPADFRVHMAAGHTDQELFDWVTNGVDGTAMPPFRDTLTEEERWHVINFLRTFANPTPVE